MQLPSAMDLMVPLESYPHVQAGGTLLEALVTMNRAHIHMHGETSLPRILLVFDDEGVLIGMLRRRDILRGLSPRWFFSADSGHPEDVFATELDENISDVLADKVVQRFKERAQQTVDDYIQGISGVVDVNDSLITLVNIMVKKGYHMLPVLQGEQVVGVVRSVEVMWAVNELQDGNPVAIRGEMRG
ncbi:MAG: CBS domain-containing protein [Pseudomonadota bacterium]